MKWLRSSLVQNVPPLVTCSNYQGVRDLESVLSAPESALETVNPDRSGARWRNLLNVFNSIGHVRRSPAGGHVHVDGQGRPGAQRLLVGSEFMMRGGSAEFLAPGEMYLPHSSAPGVGHPRREDTTCVRPATDRL